MSQKKITAAITRSKGADFTLEELNQEAPKAGEVRVKVVATGLCHTDLIIRDQYYPVPLPAILGHEGAGVVDAVGEGVSQFQVGDHVVCGFDSCGHCLNCEDGHPAYCNDFSPLNFGGQRLDETTAHTDKDGGKIHDHFFGQSTFSTFAIARERNLVKVPKDAPLELLGPLGCGIMTGSGAVLQALQVRPGSSFASFGAGAVGLSSIMAAKVAGATTIIAVDVVPSRLELAKELGATHTINSKDENPVEKIQEITGGGVKFALESSGIPAVLRQAIDSLGIQGTCGIVGAPKMGTEASFDVNMVMLPGKKIMGIIEGDVVPRKFIPQLVELHKQGRFPFDKLIKFYDFASINEAVKDSESGKTIKAILKMPS